MSELQVQKAKACGGRSRKNGFTLPEVIVSFSVIVMVIVSATNILTMVMRTNADNVDSMLAYGLAQQGMESLRFIRDSNAVLGLEFDGSAKAGAATKVWGEKLFESAASSPSEFVLIDKKPSTGCKTNNLADCMPVSLKAVTGSSVGDLAKSDQTLVYLNQTATSSDGPGSFQYLQTGGDISYAPAGAVSTPFHRILRVEPNSESGSTTQNSLRVSSMVFWNAAGIDKKVVLTSELTDWK